MESHRDRWDPRPLVLIAGGGVAALEAVLALQHFAGGRVRMELLAPADELVYRPLLVAEPFGATRPPAVAFDALLRGRPVRHVRDALTEVRAEQRCVRTAGGAERPFDALLIATGAHATAAIDGALTFDGREGIAAYRELLENLHRGSVRRVIYCEPRKSGWTLPLYELALLTAAHLFERRIAGVELAVVTAEPAPLAAFGGTVSWRVAGLLRHNGIALTTGARHSALMHDGTLAAQRVVALPHLEGPWLPGVPHDEAGFIPVDGHGRVDGLRRVYAAGDVTTQPIKQGGIATQQADAAAAAIAAWAGAPIRPSPFRPVLRGLLMTDERPVFMRAERVGSSDAHSLAGTSPLWWPGAKIAGRYLTAALAAHGGIGLPPDVRRSSVKTGPSR